MQTTQMTFWQFRARFCRDLAISRTSARRVVKVSRLKSLSNRPHCSYTPATPLWTRDFLMPCRSAPTALSPMPAVMSRSIPRNRIKAGIDYSVTDAFKVGGDALFVGSQYFVGDESNQAQRLPSYAVFNLHASYQINKTFQIYARADNIFDNRYATYGRFFDTGTVPNFANGGAPFTDARSLSPARPRAFYAGLRTTF